MEKLNWSPSRFGCYTQCPVKYKFTYIDGLTTYGRAFDVATKGTCFHKIAEETQPGESYESVYARAEKTIAEYDFDKEKYPVIKAVPVFYKWWTTYVEPLVKAGFEIHKETWKNDVIAINTPLVGAVDLYLVNKETKECYIFDYKSGGTPKMDDTYANQLTLYTYMLANELHLEGKEITDKIHRALFYPLADIAKIDITDDKAVEKRMLKDIVQLPLTYDEYNSKMHELIKIVETSDVKDWASLDLLREASVSYGCNFCEIAGSHKYCPHTANSGVAWPKGVIVCTAEENKIAKAAEFVENWNTDTVHTDEEIKDYEKAKKLIDNHPEIVKDMKERIRAAKNPHRVIVED